MAMGLHILILSFVLQDAGTPVGVPMDYESLVQRARAEYRNGNFIQSQALFTAALQTLLPGEDGRRAQTRCEMGDVYVNLDKFPEAEQAYLESLRLYKRLGDKAHTAEMLRNLGAVYAGERRDNDAMRTAEEALKIARAVQPPDAVLKSRVLNTLGVVNYRQGNLSKAENLFKESLRMIPDSVDPYTRADLLNNLAAVDYARHRFERAEQYFKKALDLIETQVGPAHPDLTFMLTSLGIVYTGAGQYTKAEQQYLRALAILDTDAAVFGIRIARLLTALSRTYAAAGRKLDAEATLSRAATIARRNVAANPDMAAIMDSYAETLRSNGRVKEAEEFRSEAKRARVAAGLVINALTASPF
jgi:tetratricopeptide (TPR) repeat protein